MTRDEAREALYDLIEQCLPGVQNIEARRVLKVAAIDFAHAAAIESARELVARLEQTRCLR